MFRKYLPLISIVVLGLLLRLIMLGQYPAGFAADEATQGYAAYSLLRTGADEWGVRWPLVSFRSFADFKAPLQTYLMIPAVALLGLNEFSVRLPSAIVGTLAIFMSYLLASQIFNKKTGLLAALILAISPWHLQFSRTALEANLISLLLPLGLWAFLKAEQQSKYYYLSAISWALSLYAYHSVKVYLPFFLLALSIIYLKRLQTHRHLIFLPIILFTALTLPILINSLFGSGLRRGQDLLVTNLSLKQQEELNDVRFYSPLNSISPRISQIFTNKFTYSLDKFAENYLSYLSPNFWFAQGGNEISYHNIPNTGLLYFWQPPFIIYALLNLFRKPSKLSWLFLAWILIAPLPAAITRDGNRPNRASAFLTLWEILTAYGLSLMLPHIKRPLQLTFLAVISTFFLWYTHDYFIASPITYPNSLNYGYRQVVSKVSQLDSQFDQVIIDRGHESQMFFAFYQQLDPRLYQQASSLWWDRFQQTDYLYLDMLDNYALGKYHFKSFNLDDLKTPNTLIVLMKDSFFDSNRLQPFVFDTIDYPNGEIAFYLLSTKQSLAKL